MYQELLIKTTFDETLRRCMIYADEAPEVILIQLVERKEIALLDEIVDRIHASTNRSFVLVGVPIIDWCKELMPWNDQAVDRRPESGKYAPQVLALLENEILPQLYQQYGALPVVLGGYSLGGLFALWASTRSSCFDYIAAASPSVWISNWMTYVESHPVQAKKVYMSLGDREEHCKNRYMKQVGDNIRSYHEQLIRQLGGDNTVLLWNKGGHFQDFAFRIADSYSWIILHV